MSIELDRVDAAIQALDAQRAVPGDAIVDTALAPLWARRADLLSSAPAAAQAAAQAAAPNTPTAPTAPTAPTVPTVPERLLTVLLLDVVGSTALSQHLKSEDIQHTMDGLLDTPMVGRDAELAHLLAALAAAATVLDACETVLQRADEPMLSGIVRCYRGQAEVGAGNLDAARAALSEAEAAAAALHAEPNAEICRAIAKLRNALA